TSRRRHTRFSRDWSSDVCSSDLKPLPHDTDEPATDRLGALLCLGLHHDAHDRLGARLAEQDPTGLAERLGLEGNCRLDTLVGLEIGRASCRERVETPEVGGTGKT